MSSKQRGCLSLLLLAPNLNLKAWYRLGVLVVHSRASLTVCSLACHGVIESKIECGPRGESSNELQSPKPGSLSALCLRDF